MKKLFMIMMLGALTTAVQAAPGDTTTVQVQNDIWMDHFGNFDSTVKFPDGSTKYRKILMTFKLGRYACPGNPQYCGDWDYTVSVFVTPKNGDTYELGRLITPYAGDGWPRTSTAWTQRYVYDVTDFYPLLKDSCTVRIRYSGYSWGFTGNVKFDMIEGVPPRDVLGVDELWTGSFGYGRATPIDSNITVLNKTAPSNTVSTDMKFVITGHGGDINNCSEFCSKYYQVKLNSTQIAQTDIWRDDCGFNHMYPQNGTWVYDRANWCPGDKVFENVYNLANVTGGNSYDIDIDFEAYTGAPSSSGSQASYIIAANSFYYAGFNKSIDASLDDIIAPSDHETHFRENPVTGRPKVTIQNTGGTTITSVKFRYGVAGSGKTEEFTWQGSLGPLDVADVELGVFFDFRTMSAGTYGFDVEIIEVNGQQDEDATNNKMSSTFENAPKYPMTIYIELKTNASRMSNGMSQTTWKIVDVFNDKTYYERINTTPNTTYTDTVELGVGMYKLVVEDGGCNGLYWWANAAEGRGSIQIKRKGTQVPIALKGYLGADFGCGFTEYFNVDWPAAVSEIEVETPELKIHPNPATSQVNVSLKGVKKTNGKIQLLDVMGRVVKELSVNSSYTAINTSQLSSGTYTVVYVDNTNNVKLQQQVVLAK